MVLQEINWTIVWAALGSIATILAVVTSFIILFLQRYFDNKRFNKQNEARICITGFHPSNIDLVIGNYYNTDVEIKGSPFEKSQISFSVLNIGNTPISNVKVQVKIPDVYNVFKYYINENINEPLNINSTGSPEIYLTEVEGDKISYNLIDDMGKSTIINSYSQKKYRIDPIMSGTKVDINLSSREELYIQYLIYMTRVRSFFENIVDHDDRSGISIVNKRFSQPGPYLGFIIFIEFDDYLGKRQCEEFYLGLFLGGAKPSLMPNLKNGKTYSKVSKIEWNLEPLSNEDIIRVRKKCSNLSSV